MSFKVCGRPRDRAPSRASQPLCPKAILQVLCIVAVISFPIITASIVHRYDMLALTDFQHASHRLQRMASRQLIFNHSRSFDQFGAALASLGDIDADGFAEFAVTSWHQAHGHVVVDIIRITTMSRSDIISTYTVVTNYTQHSFATSLSLVGYTTLTIEGQPRQYTTLAVGVPLHDTSGVVFILTVDHSGAVVAEPHVLKPNPNSENAQFGASLAYIGDLDGDGHNDLLIGAPGQSALYTAILGPKAALISMTLTHQSINRREAFASSMASIGDMNADGTTEVLIASAFNVHLVCLDRYGHIVKNTPLILPPSATRSLVHSSSLSFVGLDDADNISFALGNGFDNDGGKEKGAIWVATIDANGVVIRCVKFSQTQGNLDGNLERGDHFGASLATAFDVNKDGFAELLVGVPHPPTALTNLFRRARPKNTRSGSLWILDIPGTRAVRVLNLEKVSPSSTCIRTKSKCTCSYRQAHSTSCLSLAQVMTKGSLCHERICSRVFECGTYLFYRWLLETYKNNYLFQHSV